MKKAVPAHTIKQFFGKKHDYAVGIPVINEGKKIQKQLTRMHALGIHKLADILIFDGGSTDGSLSSSFLRTVKVRALLTKTGPGRQGAQLRTGFNFVIKEKYKGIITIDGNGKDSIENIPDFIAQLKMGYDFIQASRFIPGGKAINTPWQRHFAIRYIHSPWISWLAGFHYTDTTSGYRGISTKLLKDPRLALFRDIFDRYELLFYMSVMAPRLGYRVREYPTTRKYPKGSIPTKMKWQDNLKVIGALWKLTRNYYQP